MKLCQICGEENSDDAKYCKKCKAALEKLDLEEETLAKEKAKKEENEKIFKNKGESNVFSSNIKRGRGRPKNATHSWEKLRVKTKKWDEMSPEEKVVRKKTHYIMIFWIMIGLLALMFIARYIVFQ